MSSPEMIKDYDKNIKKKILICLIFLALLLVAGLICTSIGITSSSMGMVFTTVIKALSGQKMQSTSEKVLFNLRFPRTLMAVIAGFGLSVSGSVMQGITRNPLVSPFTIGVSAAAAFGASLSIVFGLGFMGGTNVGTVLMAFFMAFMCAFVIFIVSSRVNLSPISIVLTGTAVNYLFQALSTSVQFVASEAKLSQVVAWSFGSVNGIGWSEVKISFVVIFISFILLVSQFNNLSIMSVMDDDISKTMGINTDFVRGFTTILSVIITAGVISFTGVIGFVGLAAPHIARSFVGNDYRFLVILSSIIGALLVLISDTIGRSLFSPIMIPVGIVISIIGVPIFIHQVSLSNKKN